MPKLVDTHARQTTRGRSDARAHPTRGTGAVSQRGVAREAGIGLSSLQAHWPLTQERLLVSRPSAWVRDVASTTVSRCYCSAVAHGTQDSWPRHCFRATMMVPHRPSLTVLRLRRASAPTAGGLWIWTAEGARVQCHETLLDLGLADRWSERGSCLLAAGKWSTACSCARVNAGTNRVDPCLAHHCRDARTPRTAHLVSPAEAAGLAWLAIVNHSVLRGSCVWQRR
jgi:hypothetical protein